MRNGPSSRVLATAASWTPRVSSWLGGTQLAGDVPVVRGRVTWNVANKVMESCRLTVARFADGRDWLPRLTADPLARYGQQLDVGVRVDGLDVRLGRFQIESWSYDEHTVSVAGSGLMQSAVDDRLLEAASPRDGATLRSEFVRFLPGRMSAQFDTGLPDRTVPAAMNWTLERVDVLYEIARAWPGVLRSDSWGQVLVKRAPELGAPVLSLTDGEGGTLVRVPRRDTRAAVHNVVQAVSSADGVVASAVAVTTSGPMSVDTYGAVAKTIASPLLLTDAQCFAAAETERQSSIRRSSVLQVSMAPDPRLELDDPVEIWRDDIRDWGLVVAADIPLTVADGDMRLDVGVL